MCALENGGIEQPPDKAPLGPLARGFHLLSRVASVRAPIGVSELAQLCKLDKATTSRLASKLTELGYLVRDDHGKFRLGLRVLDLGFAFLSSLDVRTQALPEMQRLHEEFDGPITLSALDGLDIVYLERIAPRGFRVSMQIGVGTRLPMHCNAGGKAILAFSPANRRAAFLDRLAFTTWTEHTVPNREALEVDLEAARHSGFAIATQEMVDGLCAAAAPIFDRYGVPIAAVSVALSVHSCPSERLVNTVGPRVAHAGDVISALLGAPART